MPRLLIQPMISVSVNINLKSPVAGLDGEIEPDGQVRKMHFPYATNGIRDIKLLLLRDDFTWEPLIFFETSCHFEHIYSASRLRRMGLSLEG